MIIYPLGTGEAFTERYYHNNYVIELDGKRLLIDAGTTLRYSLKSAGFSVRDIDYAVISHFHFDHVGGLEELITRRYWMKGESEENLKVITHSKQKKRLQDLLKPGLCNQGLILEDFCDFIVPPEESSLDIGPFQIQFIDTTNLHAPGMQSFAFKITDTSSSANILFSSDIKQLKDSKLLSYIDEKTGFIFQDTSFTANHVHATIQEVLDYYPAKLHSKIRGMHYSDDIESDDHREIQLVQERIPIQL
jgi:hydroxyacylglutathione hydrolase